MIVRLLLRSWSAGSSRCRRPPTARYVIEVVLYNGNSNGKSNSNSDSDSASPSPSPSNSTMSNFIHSLLSLLSYHHRHYYH